MLVIRSDRASGVCIAGSEAVLDERRFARVRPSCRLLGAGFTAVMLAACAQPSVVSEQPAPVPASQASPRPETSGSPAPVRHAALGSADASSTPARKATGKIDVVE